MRLHKSLFLWMLSPLLSLSALPLHAQEAAAPTGQVQTPAPDQAPAVVQVQPRPKGPARISGGVMAGAIVNKVNPVYPAEARSAHMGGSVVLRAIIGKDGTIKDLTVVSGPDLLAAAAVDAVRQWTYKPYLLNGEPTEVDTTIMVNFNIGSGPNSNGLIRISGGVLQGQLLKSVPPEYPEAARAAQVSGSVVIQLIVTRQGIPINLTAISGPPLLQNAALDAVRHWHYKPYLLNGQPVDVQSTVLVNFNLN